MLKPPLPPGSSIKIQDHTHTLTPIHSRTRKAPNSHLMCSSLCSASSSCTVLYSSTPSIQLSTTQLIITRPLNQHINRKKRKLCSIGDRKRKQKTNENKGIGMGNGEKKSFYLNPTVRSSTAYTSHTSYITINANKLIDRKEKKQAVTKFPAKAVST